MRKEQILLVVCILAAVVIAYANLGLYESVKADAIPRGKDVGSSVNAWYDPQSALTDAKPSARTIVREHRVHGLLAIRVE